MHPVEEINVYNKRGGCHDNNIEEVVVALLG
jgi:hypothetical protein